MQTVSRWEYQRKTKKSIYISLETSFESIIFTYNEYFNILILFGFLLYFIYLDYYTYGGALTVED